jgi:hypothetical protein
MKVLIHVAGRPIRTDWINRITSGKENGVKTCSVWFSVGSVGAYHFKGKDAQTALKLLADHPALGLEQSPSRRALNQVG